MDRMHRFLVERLGKVCNLVRLPGFVRNCRQTSSIADVTVAVECRDRHTVVSVNEVQIYFDRLSGRIREIDINTDAACARAATGRKERESRTAGFATDALMRF